MLLANMAVAQYAPAGDKIKTRWAEQVAPENALPEYPRPMMVRPMWKNLNGLRVTSSCRFASSRRCRVCKKRSDLTMRFGIRRLSTFLPIGKMVASCFISVPSTGWPMFG